MALIGGTDTVVSRQGADGSFMGLGALAGTVIGRLYSQDDIKSAQDALKNFTSLIPLLQKAGEDELNNEAPFLEPLANKLFTQLANFAQGGYVPDYLGIMNRATQAASFQVQRQITEAQREQRRYGLGINADVEVRLRTQQALSVVASYALAAEQARQFMWTTSFDLFRTGAMEIEEARIKRLETGGQFIGSAIDEYIEVNNAYREIAAVNVGDFAMVGTALAELIPTWFGPQWIQNAMTGGGGIIP